MKQLAIHDYRNAAITIAALVGLIFVVNATAQFAYDDHFCFEHIDKRFSLAAGWVPATPAMAQPNHQSMASGKSIARP